MVARVCFKHKVPGKVRFDVCVDTHIGSKG